MKTLTKPVKSRLPSPCIYGYECDWGRPELFHEEYDLEGNLDEYYDCVAANVPECTLGCWWIDRNGSTVYESDC